MKVSVGGVEYEVGGVPFGTLPVWRLLKVGGASMTAPQFDNLSDEDKQALAGHVQAYVKALDSR
jgi:hypothetical protein